MKKLWYCGKRYGTLNEKLCYYEKNYDTIPKTMI